MPPLPPPKKNLKSEASGVKGKAREVGEAGGMKGGSGGVKGGAGGVKGGPGGVEVKGWTLTIYAFAFIVCLSRHVFFPLCVMLCCLFSFSFLSASTSQCI